jgi:hypothetical protein
MTSAPKLLSVGGLRIQSQLGRQRPSHLPAPCRGEDTLLFRNRPSQPSAWNCRTSTGRVNAGRTNPHPWFSMHSPECRFSITETNHAFDPNYPLSHKDIPIGQERADAPGIQTGSSWWLQRGSTIDMTLDGRCEDAEDRISLLVATPPVSEESLNAAECQARHPVARPKTGCYRRTADLSLASRAPSSELRTLHRQPAVAPSNSSTDHSLTDHSSTDRGIRPRSA